MLVILQHSLHFRVIRLSKFGMLVILGQWLQSRLVNVGITGMFFILVYVQSNVVSNGNGLSKNLFIIFLDIVLPSILILVNVNVFTDR
jgi:hypothetical protein